MERVDGIGGFFFKAADSFDNVWDFSNAEGDKLRLDGSLGVDSFAEFQTHLSGFTSAGVAFTVVSFGADQLTIAGVAHTAWTSDMLLLT